MSQGRTARPLGEVRVGIARMLMRDFGESVVLHGMKFCTKQAVKKKQRVRFPEREGKEIAMT